MLDKEDSALKTIGEVAEELNLPAHVLRFWETKFPQLKPNKRRGRHRYYRPEDIDKLQQIRNLLYEQGYTIKGAQKYLRTERKVGEVSQVDLFAYSNATTPPMEKIYNPKHATPLLNEKDSAKLKKMLDELQQMKQLLTSSSLATNH